METKIDTKKILITTTYYTDQPEQKFRPITRVKTEIIVDDELYYSDNMISKLYHNTPTKLTDFLNWLFLTQPQNKGEKTVNEDLKELLTPIVQEVLNEEFKKIMTKIRSSAQ